MRNFVALLIFFSSCFCTKGQIDWNIINTTNTGDNGLVGGFVYCFHSDENNLMWIGSAFGISQFDGENWKALTSSNGLLVDEVKDIVRDKDNNLWLGYGSYVIGVSKYDGVNFTHYNTSDGLINDKVNDIIVDNTGNLWFATNGGVSKYDGTTWTSYSIEQGIPDNWVNCIAHDNKGNIWIGTRGAGTFRLVGNSFEPFCWEINSDDSVDNIYVDVFDNVWVNGSRVYKYNGVDWVEVKPSKAGTYPFINNICGSDDGKVFFSMSTGLSILENGVFSYYDTNDNLPHDNVYCSFSRNDSIWIGTENGVGVLANDACRIINTDDNGLIDNDVNSVFEDANGDFWFSTQWGVSKFNGLDWQNFKYVNNGAELRWVSKGLQDRNGDYWFATVNGLFNYNGIEWKVFNNTVHDRFRGRFKDILEDSQGNLWFAGSNYVLMFDGVNWIHFDDSFGMPSRSTYSLYEDESGRIWIGTRASISVYEQGQFTHFLNEVDYPSTSLINGFIKNKNGDFFAYGYRSILKFTNNSWELYHDGDWITGALCDEKNQLWFSTFGEGVLKFNGVELTRYRIEDGLSSNVVNSIHKVSDGMLYACTQNGITQMSFLTTEVSEKRMYKDDSSVVYPNPTRSQVTVLLKKRFDKVVIDIYNQLGQLVDKKSFLDTSECIFDIQGADGIYFLNVFSGSNRAVVKVIKE